MALSLRAHNTGPSQKLVGTVNPTSAMIALKWYTLKLDNTVESSKVIIYFVTLLLSISLNLKTKVSDGNDFDMFSKVSSVSGRHAVDIRQMREQTNFLFGVINLYLFYWNAKVRSEVPQHHSCRMRSSYA